MSIIQMYVVQIKFTIGIVLMCGYLCSQDYIIILLESERKIDVHWRVENETGSGSWDGFQLGFSQLHITRYINPTSQ